ncbi:phage tail protein [Citrobacter portucalensis]|nr:phage tail protein [Citrobacter portucalensis]
MADYYSIITNRGKELEAEALASGRLIVLTHFVVGDSNGKQVKPDPAQIRLINETFRGDIAELVVSPEQSTQLMAKIVLPIGVGGFTVREVGLMTDAGELYAVANCPSIDKPVGGVSVNMQFRLAVSDTSNITLNVATGDGLFLRIDQNLKEIKARGAEAQKTSRESIGVLDGTTQQRGLVQLNSALNSTSETQAATPAAVKIVMDNANARLAKDRNGADIPNVALFLQNLGLEDLAKTSANNTFTGEVKFTLSVSLPTNTAYKGIGLQAWFDYKQDKDDTLTALSGKDVAGLLSYLGLTSAAKTDAQNTFTQKQTFSGSVALPSDTTLNGTGLEYLFDSKLDASKALGTGQTWVNVTASRTSGVTYTNSTTRPICVSIPETGDGDRGLYVGGVLTAFARGADSDSTLFAIVPPGAQYIFSGAFSSWAELR